MQLLICFILLRTINSFLESKLHKLDEKIKRKFKK